MNEPVTIVAYFGPALIMGAEHAPIVCNDAPTVIMGHE